MAFNSLMEACSSGPVPVISDTAVRTLSASLACEQSIQTVIEVTSSANAAFAAPVETITKTIRLITRAEAAPKLVPATTADALVIFPSIHAFFPPHANFSDPDPEGRKTSKSNALLVWDTFFIVAGLIVIAVLIGVLVRLLRRRQSSRQRQHSSRLRDPEQWIRLTHAIPARTLPRNNQS